MARFISDQNQTGFFYESGTYANTSGALQWIGMVQSNDIGEENNIQQIRYQGGGDRDVDFFQATMKDIDGTVTYFPQDWKFLAFALGSNVDAGSPSPYTHTISAIDSDVGNAFTSGTLNPFISFGIEDSKKAPGTGNNLIRTVKGAMVNSMSVSASQGDIINVDVEYMAKEVNFSSGAPSAITAATTRPFLFQDAQLHIPSGTTYTQITDFTFTVNNNLNRDHYPNGSAEAEVLTPTNREYSLEVTFDANSERAKTIYDQYYNGGSSFNALFVINASTGSREMIATLSGCRVTSHNLPSPNEGMNEHGITITPEKVNVLVNDAIEKYNAW